MVDTLKLKGLLMEKGYKQSDAAKWLGVSPQTFNYKINNKNDFLSSEIAILCEKLDVKDGETVIKIFFANNVN